MTSKEEILEFATVLSENLASGSLEQVVSLFQYNETLYETLPLLLKSEKVNVRLGITIVMEDLLEMGQVKSEKAIMMIRDLLKDESPTARGDAANIVGILGDDTHLSLLEPMLQDENAQVVEVVEDAIEEIQERIS